jgi:hypothetical protein
MQNLTGMFVDSDEKQVAVLGGNYLQNFLATGSLEKGFCAVSNRRAYFKGKCYYKVNGSYKTSREERIVDLGDVTGSGFVFSNLVPLIVKIIMTVVAVVFIIGGLSVLNDDEVAALYLIVPGIVDLVCLIAACIKKHKIFEISYAGGGIAFKASNYNERETQQFQKALRKAKDEYVSVHKAQTIVQQMPVQPQPQQATMSVADQLKQYKELLDSGVITQEEFDKMKGKLLG